MLLYLVRHGQTNLNKENIIQGHLDIPLSSTGKLQSEKLARRVQNVSFTEAWCGDLLRAHQTAEIVLSHQSDRIGLRIDDRLRSRDMGSLQGCIWRSNMTYSEDVESDEELGDRLHDWLSRLITFHTPTSSPTATPHSPQTLDKSGAREGRGNGTVLAVTHQECLLEILRILTCSTTSTSQTAPPISTDHTDHSTHHSRAPFPSQRIRKPMLDLHIPHDTDLTAHIGNTAVAVMRVWWEEDENGRLEPRGRLEAWASDDHLQDGEYC